MIDWKDKIRERLTGLNLDPTREAEIVEELNQHLDDRYSDLLSAGITPDDAFRAVLAELSDSRFLAEELKPIECRVNPEPPVPGAARISIISDIWQDLRYSWRMLSKHRGFTALSLVTLALGIGVNTAIFSVVNPVLLRPLAYPDSDQLVMIWGRLPGHGLDKLGASPAEFVDYREQHQVFLQIGCYSSLGFNLSGIAEPERITGTYVTHEVLSLLGVPPAKGRLFMSEEDQPGGNHVVILSHRLWQRSFSSNENVLGRGITLNGISHTIVGIMPASFQFPDVDTDIWKPIGFSAEDVGVSERGSHYLSVLARLRPEVNLEQAQSDVAQIASRMQSVHPAHYDEKSGWGADVVRLHDEIVGDVELTLMVLLAAVGCVLLIACANVANLLLARAITRRREMALRLALGASRRRLVQQLLTESLLLAVAGGTLGIPLAFWTNEWFMSLDPAYVPRLSEIGIDLDVLAFTIAVSLVTGLLFGLAPAWQSTNVNLNESLKDGGKTTGSSGIRLRGFLVASQFAITFVLLVAAGLMLKSLYRLQQVEPGIDPSNVLSMRLNLPQSKYADPQRQRAFFEELISQTRLLPGVRSVGAVNFLPLSGTGNQRNFSIEGQPDPKLNLEFRMASPDYFPTLGIQLSSGRLFNERDRENAPRVAVVNETLARLFFSNTEPIGKRIRLGNERGPFPWLTVVGVTRDVKHGGLDKEIRPEMYVPYLQPLLPNWNTQTMFLVLRADSDPSKFIPAARGVVQKLDSDQPVYSVSTMEQLLNRSLTPRRFNMWLLGAFAVLALVLSVIGIYGVMSYSVSQRINEIGIRIALGARTRDVLKLVIWRGMKLALIGVAIGLIGAFLITRTMERLLFNVSTTDTLTFVVISILIIVVALMACLIPSRRATRVDPIVALRYE
jgi:putative ABC transport system permease protein